MRKSLVKRLFLLPVLFGFAWISCKYEHVVGTKTVSGGDATVTFALDVPGNSAAATRGLSENDETNVETVDVLLFRKEGANRLYHGRVLGVLFDNTSGGIKTFNAVIPVKDYSNYDITVIANGRDIILNAELSQGDEKSVALNRLIKTIPAGEKWNSNRIPMWGEALNVDVNENSNLSGVNAVKMTRMIIRIDVKLSKKAATGSDAETATGNANFALESVRLYNYSTRGTVVPDLADGWSTGDAVNLPKATAPNQPAGGYGKALYGDGNDPLVYTTSDQHASATNLPDSLIRAIYILEAPKGSGSTLETNTCLVIGGRYRGDANETYYRIDFAQKNNVTHQYDYLHLLRNHRHLIYITKISGAGFETPDEAFYSRPVNIEARILAWNDGEIDNIVFDGHNFLGVSPAEFELDKDARSGNKITISTDVLSGWSITGITDSDQPGVGSTIDWIYDIDGSCSTSGSKDLLIFKVKENDTDNVRCAWIHIKAGRLNFAVKVTQSTEFELENYRIVLTDGQGTEVSELVFSGAASDTPASQYLYLQWHPAGIPIKAMLIPDTTDPLVSDYDPSITANTTDILAWDANGHRLTVSPAPIGTSSTGDDFFERSSKVLFELQTPAGPMIKILTLRQTNFNLLPQIGVMLMDGKPQSLRVRANFTWKAEFISASSEDAPSFVDRDIVKRFDTQYGGNNTARGDIITFTCADFISNYSDANPKKAVVKVKFWRLYKNRWVEWGIQDIPCYAVVPVGESNCYMINNNRPAPISIPVSQVGYAMKASTSGFLGSSWITDYSKLKVQVLWSDVNKFGTEDAVVKAVAYNGARNVADGRITVIPGDGAGNALVILYEDNDGNDIYNSGDAIRWSWHIWKSDYYPYDAYGNPDGRITSSNASLTNGKWMDRNLGAMSNSPGSVSAMGFHYQWGRKDPFPGNSQWNSTFKDYLYYATGSGVTFKETETPTQTNLPNSVQNPLTRYFYSSDPWDWFTTTSSTQNGNLWGGGTTTAFLHASGKSVYDPCPEGYRLPKNGTAGWGTTSNEASWQTFANYGRVNNNYGGYYPATGGRNQSKTGLSYVGSGGYYWQDAPNGANGSYLHTSSANVEPNVSVSRAYGYSVRCVADK